MNIDKYIVELLKDNEKLVVPGLGSFAIEYIATTINPVDNTFTPPVKNILFDSITPDDDLLAQKIAEQENIHIDTAIKAINKFSDALASKIQKAKPASIKGLGIFSLNTENQIAFKPEISIVSDEEFGLTGFASPTIEKPENKNDETLNTNTSEVKTEEPLIIENIDEEITNGSKKYKKYLTIAVFTILITAPIYLVFFTDIFNKMLYSDNEKIEQKITEIAKPIEPSKTVDTIENKADSSINNNTAIESKSNTSNESVIKDIQQTKIYFIIEGTYRIEKNAEKRVKELIKNNFKNAGVTKQNNSDLFMVYYNSFNIKDEAQKELQKIKEVENPDSWIYKIK